MPVPIAALPANSASVEVGPPLFARGPRLISAEVFVVAQAKIPWDTRLLATVAGEVRFTVPPPAKSPPLVLLAMMVLAILRLPKLMMPPPLNAELPEKVELVTVALALLLLSMPPPLFDAVLPEKVELETVRVAWLKLKIPPPLPAVEELPEKVELVTVRLPRVSLKMPAP